MLSRYRFQYAGARSPCNLCGADDTSVVARRDRWMLPLTNVMCNRCGLVFLCPMPSNTEVDEHYRSDFWLRTQGGIDPSPKQIKRSMRNAADRLKLLACHMKPGSRILDVGAGGGEFVALAQSQGYVAEGVEPGAAYAEYARRRYGVKINAAPFLQVDFGDQVFDMVTCSHALEHMRDPLAALKKMHSLLAPDGRVHIWVPDLAKAGNWPYRCFHPGHLHGFTRETLLMMMAKAGFEIPADPPPGTYQILKRGLQPDPNWFRFPDHAASFKSLRHQRTVWRYLISWSTWRRIPARIAYSLMDRLFPRQKTPVDQGR